jgi:hypothetical protein
LRQFYAKWQVSDQCCNGKRDCNNASIIRNSIGKRFFKQLLELKVEKWIEYSNPRFLEIHNVAGHYTEIVQDRYGSDKQIWLAVGIALFASLFDHSSLQQNNLFIN